MRKSWNINRRMLLRGAGTSLALPWLEGMSWAGEAAKSKPRMCLFHFHYGVPMPPDDHPLRQQCGWFPVGQGADYQCTGTTQSLDLFRDKVTYFSGLSHPSGRENYGHAAGDIFLTGADISGNTYRQSISVDQVAAKAVEDQTRFSSLVMSSAGGINRPYLSSTLSYDRDGRPIPAQNNPRAIFSRLFQQTPGDERQRLKNQSSILDGILEDAKSLNRRLGKRDQQKMDEYLKSVREVEKSVHRAQSWLHIPKPKVDGDSLKLDVDPAQAKEYIRVMMDLIVLALQTDSTRVATYQISGEHDKGPEVNFPAAAGINKIAHYISHRTKEYEQWSKYVQFVVEQYAYFLGKLDGIEDTEGVSLLDNTMTLYGSCCSRTHTPSNYPLILSGGNNLGLSHGQYREIKESEVPLSNLFVTLLDRMGTSDTAFSDSNAAMSEMIRS